MKTYVGIVIARSWPTDDFQRYSGEFFVCVIEYLKQKEKKMLRYHKKQILLVNAQLMEHIS